MAFLMILIPLYIVIGYAKGYDITASRRHQTILDTIQKWGFSIAGIFFGTGVAMSFLPDNIVVTEWSDGRKESVNHSDVPHMILFVMKAGLVIVGVLIFSFCLCAHHVLADHSGLRRKGNWQALSAKMKK